MLWIYSVFICFLLSRLNSAWERNGDLSSFPETVFGEKTFLPEIFPVSVSKSIVDNGYLSIQVNVLYTENALISWYANGIGNSTNGEIYLRATGRIPSEYTLNLVAPRSDEPRSSSFSNARDGDNAEVINFDDILEDEDGDFLVDENELYIKFQTLTLSETASIKISLNVDDNGADDKDDDAIVNDNETDFDDNGAVENDANGSGNGKEKVQNDKKTGSSGKSPLEERRPQFPEMIEIENDDLTIRPGARTRLEVAVMFSDSDRFTVRGIFYNSTVNQIFTTLWSTDFMSGPSDFEKIPTESGEDYESFDDLVTVLGSADEECEQHLVRRIVIDIPTQKEDISGVIKIIAHHDNGIDEDSFISESSLEQMVILRKESQIEGPIPSGILTFEGGDYAKHTCIIGAKCLVSCRVLGINVEQLNLMHKDAGGDFAILQEEHVEIGAYEASVFVPVDSANPDFSGVYLCEATSGPVTVSKEIDLLFEAQQ